MNDMALYNSSGHQTPGKENAMSTTPGFTQKFAPAIVNVLGCFDRVIFKGHLPFGNDSHLNQFVDGVLRIRRIAFLPLVEQLSQALVDVGKALATEAGAPYHYFEGRRRKEDLVRKILRERPRGEGLVAVLCFKETCRGVKLAKGAGRPRLYYSKRPQRVLYYYFLDPHCGLMHVRVQTFFPFTVQVYVNGHEWLAQQMLDRQLGFVQQDNAFVQLDDAAQAQQIADRFPHLPWPKILDRWAQAVLGPLTQQPWLQRLPYYWVIDQAEFSTDVLFRSRAQLAELYPRLLEHALLQFSAADILTFLGRKLDPRFRGEVLTEFKNARWPGARVKHRMKNNWLKMYDKFGLLLRIETVINQPREFRVRRSCTRQGATQMAWLPMNKGVSNFYHYHEVAQAANSRYLNALAVVDMPSATRQQLDRISRPVRYHQRRQRGLHLLAAPEHQLFVAVLRGDHLLNGFRNRDLADHLYPRPTPDPQEQRRRTARISRQMQLLRAHGLIAKIPHSYRYQVTAKGHAIMSTAVYLRHKAFPNELQGVA
jgi:hypothetical protein